MPLALEDQPAVASSAPEERAVKLQHPSSLCAFQRAQRLSPSRIRGALRPLLVLGRCLPLQLTRARCCHRARINVQNIRHADETYQAANREASRQALLCKALDKIIQEYRGCTSARACCQRPGWTSSNSSET